MKTNIKKNGGFTLVELIVVIAILAILSAVAIPAYSGYIEKAEKAGDLQLLGAINTAYAAACMAGGEDIHTISGASIILKEGKVISVSPYDEEFKMFYAGNEDAKFSIIKGLLFDLDKRVFVDPTSVDSVKVGLPGGGSMTISAAQAETFQKSTYAGMGASAVTGQVDSVAGLAADLIYAGIVDGGQGNVFYTMTHTDEYMASIGLDENKIIELTKDCQSEEEANRVLANYLANSLVVSAATHSQTMTATQVAQKLESNPDAYISDIKTRLNNTETAGAALADAAVVYGVYTSYVNKYYTGDEAKAKLEAVDGADGLINAMDEMQTSDQFKEYMGGQGASDVNAYLEAMKVINTATSGENTGTANEVYSNGFTGTEINDLLAGLLGKN